MRNAALLLALLISTTVWAEQNICPNFVPAEVESKLLPVLDARDQASKKNDWWDKGYENAFANLLKSKDEASKEARIALMDYYVGEAYGEELVCAVARDGGKSVTWLELYSRCNIKAEHSVAPRNHALPLRDIALKIIKDGHVEKSCTYD